MKIPAYNILNSKKLLKIIPWVGRLLMFFGIIFVAKKLGYYLNDVSQSFYKPAFWEAMIILSLIYGIAELLNAYGWTLLLRTQGIWHTVLSWKEAYSLYGKTQIAKYIPGNIFHFVNRHILTNRQGLNHTSLVAAVAFEILFQSLSAVFIGLLAIRQIIKIVHPSVGHIIAAFSVFIAIFCFVLFYHHHNFLKIYRKLHWQYLILSQACYFSFLILACFLFLVALSITSENSVSILANWPLIMGGYALAWLAGFLVPGAPGGFGIRETILLVLLAECLPESDLLESILMFRIVSILGDSLFYLFATIFDSKKVSTFS